MFFRKLYIHCNGSTNTYINKTLHRIRELVYFRMIHEPDLVCRQSTRMDRQTFAILCHLLRNVAGLSSTEIVDVEKMVAMFLHVLAHDVKNRVIQWEFVRSGETVSRHFNIVCWLFFDGTRS
ncbi:hypothetical protein IC575_011943 [Cucumis melo]